MKSTKTEKFESKSYNWKVGESRIWKEEKLECRKEKSKKLEKLKKKVKSRKVEE